MKCSYQSFAPFLSDCCTFCYLVDEVAHCCRMIVVEIVVDNTIEILEFLLRVQTAVGIVFCQLGKF